ncbi:MAG TPA: TolC family protein [Bryobacteraceae bacterium]|nr:TolC family protein [Bryobacteraceae bacterium]
MTLHKRHLPFVLAALSWAMLPALCRGQAPGGAAPGGGSRATSLPLSGRSGQENAVTAQQSATSGSGVATVSSSIQVGGNFAGSVPTQAESTGPLSLTMAEAVKKGLAANLGVIASDASSRATRAARLQSLSSLLPDISLSASETVTQVNLAAYGLKLNIPTVPGIPSFNIPTVVGPYSYSQLQGNLSQSVFDPVRIRNWKASKETERASLLSAKDARELVVFAVAGTYLQLEQAVARVESQQAQVANAEAIHRQAAVRKEVGTNAKIDVVRTMVELQTQQQRLASFRSDVRKQEITLARLVGLPQDRKIVPRDALYYHPVALPEVEQEVAYAWAHRSDLRQAEAQVHAAELVLSAAHAERLPSVSLSGNYGAIGPNPTSAHGVFGVTGSINVPLYQGGRLRADIQQAEATLSQRRAELQDQKARVEQEVRTACIDLQTAAGQVQLADSNRKYAAETLAESRDRFGAGVATTVEVVQAQEQVANAESDYLTSLFSFDLARLALARATGQAEGQVPDLSGGKQ